MALPTFQIDLDLEDDPFQAAELDVHNEPNEINRLLIQTAKTASQAIFKTELQQISYGDLADSTTAALMVFQSQFLLTSRNCINRTTIRLAFADIGAPKDPQLAPRIVKIPPLWYQARPAEQRISYTNSFGLSINDPLSVMARNVTNERTQTRNAQIKVIIASHHTRKHPSILNRAI